MKRYLVAGNWKMNGSRRANSALLDGIIRGRAELAGVELLVCPPAVYLESVAAAIGGQGIGLGAQTVSEHGAGAYTGEVSAAMLSDLGCDYVLVGHSERRSLFGETDAQVAAKFAAAAAAELRPVLCVGETLDERDAGETERVVARQLAAVIDVAGVDAFADAVIAYEPVWAIGTGRTATPDQAQAVHAVLRQQVAAAGGQSLADGTRILYGGSMKPANAAELLSQPDIDGGLIGGASLNAESFLAIAAAAAAAN